MVYELRAAYHPLVWMLGFGAFLVVSGGGLALTGRLMSGAPARVRGRSDAPSEAAAPVEAAEVRA
jgi:cytochrome c-type biogenesis protein CcmF